MISSLLLLSATGGLLVWRGQSRRDHPRLIERLVPPAPLRSVQAEPPARLLTDGQNLALSITLLGMTTVGHLGIPLLRLLSTPGLLYLDFYFIHTAYRDWQRQRQMGIATNDAVLATGLMVTRQWGAGALFATFFFASRKLQALAEARLGSYQLLMAGGVPSAPDPRTVAPDQAAQTPDQPDWQSWIDRGSLPLLLLSAVSTPWLGLKRSLAVLLTNFGYDYRLVSPLSTLRYLQAAERQGIRLRDPHVLDRLQQVDVLVLDGLWDEQQVAALQASSPVPIMTRSALTPVPDPASLIARLQAEGHTVAYLMLLPDPAVATAAADLLITVAQGTAPLLLSAHVVLPTAQPAQIQQLFVLMQALAATRQRGFYFALAPGILNLGGIYFGQFGVISALLVDYGGSLVGIFNALWLPAAAKSQSAAQLLLYDLTSLPREQQRRPADGTA